MHRSAVVVWDDAIGSWTYAINVAGNDGSAVPVRSGSLAGEFHAGSNLDDIYLAFVAQVGFLSTVDVKDPKVSVNDGMLVSR